ncbi:hypothetical protein KEM56_006285 [Ascosphaera pollenicola]|nr:hypothetical protein KEM56_006285 [Ascosphaera pollenicola]
MSHESPSSSCESARTKPLTSAQTRPSSNRRPVPSGAVAEDARLRQRSSDTELGQEQETPSSAMVEESRLRKRGSQDDAGTLRRSSERVDVTQPPRAQEPASREEGEAAACRPFDRRVEEFPSAEFSPPLSRIATNIYTISYLIFFSFLGVLARLGLHSLTFYPGAPVTTGILWANVAGCVVMGFFAEDQKIFAQEWGHRSHEGATPKHVKDEKPEDASLDPAESLKKHKAVKKTISLYIGITTGFCGSFTSFSTFMSDTFLAMSNDLKNPNSTDIIHRNDGYSVMSFLAVIIYTVALSLGALYFGAHFSQAMTSFTPTIPFRFMRKILDRAVIFLAFGCWLGAVFLAIWPPDRHSRAAQDGKEFWRGRAVYALVFAPLGTLGRFYASLTLNPIVSTFPFGTFACNIFGSMVFGMCYDLQHVAGIGANHAAAKASRSTGILTSCQVLQGVQDGFCGCLTTVSTWVAELQSLELKYSYRYGIASVTAGLCSFIIICGSLKWTDGFAEPACS